LKLKKEFAPPSKENFKRVGSMVSKGVANGREVWEELLAPGVQFFFSDGGTKIHVSNRAMILFDDLLIKS
jgi:hypothetical protein